jgi:mRNA interferase RelE/StbE
MKVNFHKNSLKSLEKFQPNEVEKIRLKIKGLVNYYDLSGMIPFKDLQVKKLEGKWKGFYRMRIGKIRIIFEIDKENWELNIFEIDNRGDVYK